MARCRRFVQRHSEFPAETGRQRMRGRENERRDRERERDVWSVGNNNSRKDESTQQHWVYQFDSYK